jgi:hypothetical protein
MRGRTRETDVVSFPPVLLVGLTDRESAGHARCSKRIAGMASKPIIVETASRFACDLIVQETGYRMLRDQLQRDSAERATQAIRKGPEPLSLGGAGETSSPTVNIDRNEHRNRAERHYSAGNSP